MKNTFWFNKFGKLILLLLALLIAGCSFLPVIALPNEVGQLVNYKGIDVVLGKDIGMMLFNGVYFAKASIQPSLFILVGFYLPVLVCLIMMLVKNRRVAGFSIAASFIRSIVILLMINDVGTCYLSNTNLLTGLNELTRMFKDVDGVIQYGIYLASATSAIGLIISIIYCFADYLAYYRR